MAEYLRREDYDHYGSALIDVTQRAAFDALKPTLEGLAAQNVALERRLAQESRRNMDAAVERAIPNYREVDRDPRWHRYLLELHPLSGRPRQQWLNDAMASGDANRVIAFFKGFLQEAGSAPAQSASAPSGRNRTAPTGRIYSRDEISRLYSAHRQGAYVGRESEWARQEADIIRAGAEGRIRNPVDIAGK